MDSFFLQAFSVFSAGVLSSLSPCVYPMIPITLGYLGLHKNEEHAKTKVVLFFAGQIIAFVIIGLLAVQLGEIFGFTSQDSRIQKVIGFILVGFGLASYFNYMPSFLMNLNRKMKFDFVSQKSFLLFPFLIGASSALVASPCSSPILGSVLTTLAAAQDYVRGTLLMFIYGFGASLIFLIVGLGIMKAQSMPRAGRWMAHFHRVASILIIGVGLYYLYLGFFQA